MQPHADNAFALPASIALRPRGSGQPLPDSIQKKMETFFKTSFADVRVHVGSEAPAIGALAFTHGSDLYFAPGQYNPQSRNGQQLLGHELTHVVQQRARAGAEPARFRHRRGPGPGGSRTEADRMGMQAASAIIQARPTAGAIVPAGHQGSLMPDRHAQHPTPRAALQRMISTEESSKVSTVTKARPNPFPDHPTVSEEITQHIASFLGPKGQGRLRGVSKLMLNIVDSISQIPNFKMRVKDAGQSHHFNYSFQTFAQIRAG